MEGRRARPGIGWWLLVALGFAVANQLFYYRYALEPHRWVSDPGDPLLNLWILDWVWHALTHDPGRLLDGNILHPYEKPLAFSETLIVLGAAWGLVNELTGSPILSYQIVYLGSVLAAALVSTALLVRITDDRIAALLGAFVMTYFPARINETASIQLQANFWVPLLFLLTHRLVTDQRHRVGLVAGIALTWAGLFVTSAYIALFWAVLCPIFIVLLAPRGQRVRPLWQAAVGGGMGLLLVSPVVLAYRGVSGLGKLVAGYIESSSPHDYWLLLSQSLFGKVTPWRMWTYYSQFSPAWIFVAITWAAVGWSLWRTNVRHQRATLVLCAVIGLALISAVPWGTPLLPGLLILIGTPLAARFAGPAPKLPWSLGRTELAYGVLAATAAMMTFGDPILWGRDPGVPLGPGLFALLRVFPGFEDMRELRRISFLAIPAAGVVCGVVLAKWRTRMSRGAFAAVCATTAAITIGSSFSVGYPRYDADQLWQLENAALEGLGRTDKNTVIVDLPDPEFPVPYYWALGAMIHRRKVVNGRSGFRPKTTTLLQAGQPFFDTDGFAAALGQLGVTHAVVHPHGFSPTTRERALQRLDANPNWVGRTVSADHIIYDVNATRVALPRDVPEIENVRANRKPVHTERAWRFVDSAPVSIELCFDRPHILEYVSFLPLAGEADTYQALFGLDETLSLRGSGPDRTAIDLRHFGVAAASIAGYLQSFGDLRGVIVPAKREVLRCVTLDASLKRNFAFRDLKVYGWPFSEIRDLDCAPCQWHPAHLVSPTDGRLGAKPLRIGLALPSPGNYRVEPAWLPVDTDCYAEVKVLGGTEGVFASDGSLEVDLVARGSKHCPAGEDWVELTGITTTPAALGKAPEPTNDPAVNEAPADRAPANTPPSPPPANGAPPP